MFVEFQLFNKHLHSAYYVPGNILSTLQRLTQLILITAILSPILPMRRLGQRKVQKLVEGHIAGKQQRQAQTEGSRACAHVPDAVPHLFL